MKQPKLIDIHSHLNFAAFDEDRDAVISRTLKGGVWCVNVGSQRATSEKAIHIAENNEGMFATVGFHPIHTAKSYHDPEEATEESGAYDFNYDNFRKMAENEKVVAIGECGLDFFRIKDSELGIKDKQIEVFKKQIELALELDKPLMIHCRDAYEEVFEILNSYYLTHGSKLRGNIHFFAGTWDIAQKFLNIGFYLSFTGVITFAKEYHKVIKNMPMDKLLIETDAPYVAPEKYRGKRNEPLYVEEVAHKIARLLGMEFDRVAEITTNNARKLFNI